MSAPKKTYDLRPLLLDDPAQMSEPQLLALVLSSGTTRRAGGRLPKKSWGAVALAENLYAAAGWRLATLVGEGLNGSLDHPKRFGLGRVLGCRLMATLALARRRCQGWPGGEEGSIRESGFSELVGEVSRGRGFATDGELLALLIGIYPSDAKDTRALLAERGSVEAVLAAATPDHIELPGAEDWQYRLRGSAVQLEPKEFFRLLAGAELIRRYGRHGAPEPAGETMEALTEIRPEDQVVRWLLDPQQTIEGEPRGALLELVRSHPGLAQDLARLDELADPAGCNEIRQTLEVQSMLELLCEVRDWAHPSEVLGSRVPYAQLLALAETRLELTSEGSEAEVEPATRLSRVRDLIQRAEQQAAARPVAECLQALRELSISQAGVKRALRHLDAVALDLVAQGLDVDLEQPGRRRLLAFGEAQGADDVQALDLRQR